MKLALDPYMLRSTPLLELPGVVADLGYEYIELSPREDFTPFFLHPRAGSATVRQFKAALDAAGVKVATHLPLYRWSGPDEDERQAAVRYWKRAIELTVELDCRVMNSEFNGRPEAASLSEGQFWRSMEELLPVFERESMQLRLEPHPDDFVEDGCVAIDMIRGIDSPLVSFLYCAPHTFHMGGDIAGIMSYAGDLLTHLHVADSFDHRGSSGLRYIVNPPGSTARVHQHLDMGQGEVDWDVFFGTLGRLGFAAGEDNIMTVCVFAWEERARESSRFMREQIEARTKDWAPVTTTQAQVVYDPYSAAFQDDMQPVYRRLRDEAPLYYSEKWNFWALSRFEDVRAAARDPATFLSYEGIDIDDTAKDMSSPGFLPDIDNPRHDQLRKIVQRTFLPRTIARLEDQVRRVVTDMVDRFADRGEADIAQELSWPLPYEVFFDVLGLPTDGPDRDDLIGWSHALKDREPDDPSLTPLAWEALRQFKQYLADVLTDRRDHPREDLLTTLVTAEIDGAPFADPEIGPQSEIVGLAFVLFLAGVESTAGLVSTAFRALADHPDQRAHLLADLGACAGAVEEAIRWQCPLQVVGRTTSVPVTLHRATIPAGERVFLVYGAANRDERQFQDPDRFDVLRPVGRHMGFGEGLHGCLGAPLARLEARLALEVALPRLGEFTVAAPPQRYRSTPNMSVLASLPIAFRTG